MENKLKKNTVVFGIHAVQEALENDQLDTLYVGRNIKSDVVRVITNVARQKEVFIKAVPIEKINRKLRGKNHQGVYGLLKIIDYHNVENVVIDLFEKGKTPCFVLLSGITDIRNAGAIIRTCEAAGVHAVIVEQRDSFEFQGDLAKTSSGAVFSIPICRTSNLLKTMAYLKNSGICMLACTEKASTPIFDEDLNQPLALIFGSEGRGIRKEVLEKCSQWVGLPMTGKTPSLNVSVAAGACMYEVLRQRKSTN